MAVTFVLVNPDNDRSIDCANCPEGLDFDKASALTRFKVYAVHKPKPICIAAVDITGSPDMANDFYWAVREVRAELGIRHEYGEFDDPTYASDGPVVDIGYECPDCAAGGCPTCNRGCSSTD
jgi:hypothetical protein